ncbi:hypothetical protein LTR17_027144 [Elasticomyces elasticus]|nr:hypothetical protein LTR17_027144 [Elasticomyces elasticus]
MQRFSYAVQNSRSPADSHGLTIDQHTSSLLSVRVAEDLFAHGLQLALEELAKAQREDGYCPRKHDGKQESSLPSTTASSLASPSALMPTPPPKPVTQGCKRKRNATAHYDLDNAASPVATPAKRRRQGLDATRRVCPAVGLSEREVHVVQPVLNGMPSPGLTPNSIATSLREPFEIPVPEASWPFNAPQSPVPSQKSPHTADVAGNLENEDIQNTLGFLVGQHQASCEVPGDLNKLQELGSSHGSETSREGSYESCQREGKLQVTNPKLKPSHWAVDSHD